MALVPGILAQVGAHIGEHVSIGSSHLSLCVSTSLGAGSTLMIVTEYMSLGALDGFLRVSAVGPGGRNDRVIFFVGTWGGIIP